ncbi:MAG: hypothetical protein AAGI38_09815 [Bacteroidota bacterium]
MKHFFTLLFLIFSIGTSFLFSQGSPLRLQESFNTRTAQASPLFKGSEPYVYGLISHHVDYDMYQDAIYKKKGISYMFMMMAIKHPVFVKQKLYVPISWINVENPANIRLKTLDVGINIVKSLYFRKDRIDESIFQLYVYQISKRDGKEFENLISKIQNQIGQTQNQLLYDRVEGIKSEDVKKLKELGTEVGHSQNPLPIISGTQPDSLKTKYSVVWILPPLNSEDGDHKKQIQSYKAPLSIDRNNGQNTVSGINYPYLVFDLVVTDYWDERGLPSVQPITGDCQMPEIAEMRNMLDKEGMGLTKAQMKLEQDLLDLMENPSQEKLDKLQRDLGQINGSKEGTLYKKFTEIINLIAACVNA